ncbi:MAG: alpha-isopropylmalate synthase regulatory domain-containing protein, partial [Candidatus Nitrosocaldus sp.]
INTKLLYETSKLVASLTGIIVQPNKAIVGENAFGHESGIHTHGVLSNPLCYEPISPELVGRKRWLEAGKHAGAHGIAAMLAEYGIKPDNEQLRQIVARVKELGDKGKQVTDADLIAVASQVMNQQNLVEHVRLMDFVVTTGINVVPTASVRLVIDGKEYIVAETGVGPVDAALKAIQKITDRIASIRLSEFRLEAISGGSDALAEVSVKVEDGNGKISSARATGEDIVVASVQAMINGINKIMMKRAVDKDSNRGEVQGYTV